MPNPYRWTDEHGAEHVYPNLNRGYHCDAHGRVCSPYTPVTAEHLLGMAAKDETLGDGAFVHLRQAVDGEPINEQGD